MSGHLAVVGLGPADARGLTAEGQSALAVNVEATIRKRVWGDVDDAHDPRALAEFE